MFNRITTILFLIICILSVYFLYNLSVCRNKVQSYQSPILENYSNFYSKAMNAVRNTAAAGVFAANPNIPLANAAIRNAENRVKAGIQDVGNLASPVLNNLENNAINAVNSAANIASQSNLQNLVSDAARRGANELKQLASDAAVKGLHELRDLANNALISTGNGPCQQNSYPVRYNDGSCQNDDLTPKYNHRLANVGPYLRSPNDPRYNNINYVIYDTNPDSLPPYPDSPRTLNINDYKKPYTYETLVEDNCDSNKYSDNDKYCTNSVYINNDGKISAVEKKKERMVPVVPLSDPYKENKIIAPVNGGMLPYTNYYDNTLSYAITQPPEKYSCPTSTPIPLEILDYANKHLDNLKKKRKKKKCKRNVPRYNTPYLGPFYPNGVPLQPPFVPVQQIPIQPNVIPIQKPMENYILDNDGTAHKSSCC